MLLWLEGFDWITSTGLLDERYIGAASGLASVGAPAFGLTGRSLTGAFDFVTPELIQSPGTGNGDKTSIIGYHGRHFASAANQTIMTVRLGGFTKVDVRVQRLDNTRGDYNIVYAAADGSTLASVGPFIYGQWYYFEHEININVSGFIRTWIDGYLLHETLGINTEGASGLGWDRLAVDWPASSGLDNLYVADARVGNSPVDTVAGPFGPMAVQSLLPDDVEGDWTLPPNPVAALGSIDGNFSFAESTAVGQVLSLKFEPALYSQAGRVAGIHFSLYCERSGAFNFADVLVNGALIETVTGGSGVYVVQEAAITADPDTSLPWRPENLDLALSVETV